MEYTWHYHSPLGNITLASNGSELTGLWFDGQKYFAATLSPEHKPKNLPIFEQTSNWLDIYFSGRAPNFTPPLHLQASPFRLAVWQILQQIPFGQTITYAEIACQMAAPKSAQAVGGAVAHNPISLISPCHRVVGTSGSLTGYAGGLDKKQYLLTLEGIKLNKLITNGKGARLKNE